MTVVFSVAASAQDNSAAQANKKQRMSREQMAEAQAKHIARELALDDATSQKFVETFSAYQKEVWTLSPKGKGMRQKKDNLSDAEAEKAIKDQFEHSQKILNLRQEFYKKYSKFLTPKQILRVYELERNSMNRLAKNGRPAPGGKKQFRKPAPNAKGNFKRPNTAGKGERGKAPRQQPKAQNVN
jgi:Spy/CpxP family protein refolding chaperone